MENNSIDLKVASPPKQPNAHTWVELNWPNAKTLGKYLVWGLGRVAFSCSLFSVRVLRSSLKIAIALCDSMDGGIKHLVKLYDALPYSGVPMSHVIEASATVVPDVIGEVITDVISAIEGTQVMIIGEMGTGKSTLAQYLAYSVGGNVRVYECEGTPTDWAGLEVIGKGEDWEAINQAMTEDLEDLSRQMQIRNEQGDNALAGSERVIICEEYPELVSKVPSSGEWLERHARRGRKARRFTILLSQYDRVSAWGLEGKSDLGEAFHRIRLGKKAQAHAKLLKNEALINWLRLDKSHCLLDDQPCKLPAYREMKAVLPRCTTTTVQQSSNNEKNAEKPPEKDVKPAWGAGFENNSSDSDKILWRLIQRFGAEKSDSVVVTEVLGFTGKRYSEGIALLQHLRNRFG